MTSVSRIVCSSRPRHNGITEASNVIARECENHARKGCCGRNNPLTPAAERWEFHIEIGGQRANVESALDPVPLPVAEELTYASGFRIYWSENFRLDGHRERHRKAVPQVRGRQAACLGAPFLSWDKPSEIISPLSNQKEGLRSFRFEVYSRNEV